MSDVQNLSDEQLLAIIRRGINTNIPGSEYQRAVKELELRDREKILNKPAGQSGIFIRAGGDIRNDGIINAGHGSVIDIATAGKYESNKGVINQGNIAKTEKNPWYLAWWLKYIGWPILAGLAVWGITLLSNIKAP